MDKKGRRSGSRHTGNLEPAHGSYLLASIPVVNSLARSERRNSHTSTIFLSTSALVPHEAPESTFAATCSFRTALWTG